MAAKFDSGDDGLNDINVTPLVDIMLVLLIIFMVTTTTIVAPSIKIELPEASTGSDTAGKGKTDQDRGTVSVSQTVPGKTMGSNSRSRSWGCPSSFLFTADERPNVYDRDVGGPSIEESRMARPDIPGGEGPGREPPPGLIRFFEDLAQKHPQATMPRLNQALAYVDKMPYPKLGIVHQGILSNKSLGVLDAILQDEPNCWTAKFIRGMNHLHWPRKLGHAPLAIDDFTELIAMQKTFPPQQQRDYFALAYVALGDSYVKNRAHGLDENLARARRAWEAGLKEYPDSPELRKRLELMDSSVDELVRFVKKLRGLEDPVDTDLARVWVD